MNLGCSSRWGVPPVVEEGSRASLAIEASRSEGERVADARAGWNVERLALGSWWVYHILFIYCLPRLGLSKLSDAE